MFAQHPSLEPGEAGRGPACSPLDTRPTLAVRSHHIRRPDRYPNLSRHPDTQGSRHRRHLHRRRPLPQGRGRRHSREPTGTGGTAPLSRLSTTASAQKLCSTAHQERPQTRDSAGVPGSLGARAPREPGLFEARCQSPSLQCFSVSVFQHGEMVLELIGVSGWRLSVRFGLRLVQQGPM